MGKVSIQARKLVAFNVIFLAVATIAVVLRIISLRIRKRSWVTHDFLCLLSWVCLFGYTVDLNIGKSLRYPSWNDSLCASGVHFDQVQSMAVLAFINWSCWHKKGIRRLLLHSR